MSRPGKTSSRCFENSVSIDITSSKWPWMGQSFTITILPSFSSMVALTSPTFSFMRTSCGRWPSRICCRISGTHLGQSESVERGQPSGGLDFSYDLSRGLSDHFGVGDGLGLMRFKLSNTTQAPLAAVTTAFSTYLIGLRMITFSSSWLDSELELEPAFRRDNNRPQPLVLSLCLHSFSPSLWMNLRKSHPKTAALPWGNTTALILICLTVFSLGVSLHVS